MKIAQKEKTCRVLADFGRSEGISELLLDIEDYLQTPDFFPDFVEKFLILATNSRQLMELYRGLTEQVT